MIFPQKAKPICMLLSTKKLPIVRATASTSLSMKLVLVTSSYSKFNWWWIQKKCDFTANIHIAFIMQRMHWTRCFIVWRLRETQQTQTSVYLSSLWLLKLNLSITSPIQPYSSLFVVWQSGVSTVFVRGGRSTWRKMSTVLLSTILLFKSA